MAGEKIISLTKRWKFHNREARGPSMSEILSREAGREKAGSVDRVPCRCEFCYGILLARLPHPLLCYNCCLHPYTLTYIKNSLRIMGTTGKNVLY